MTKNDFVLIRSYAYMVDIDLDGYGIYEEEG